MIRPGLGFVRAYVRFYGVVKDLTDLNLPGLGYAVRSIRRPLELNVHGRRFHFEPAVAASYLRLVGGSWNEPETHAFLNRVLGGLAGAIDVVDVGASIGSHAIDAAAHPHVRSVLAFEPDPASAGALRASAALNGFEHLRVVEKAVNDDGAPVIWRADTRSPSASGIALGRESEESGTADPGGVVEATTLDAETAGLDEPVLLVVDVEGAEPLVLRGGRALLERTRPLVVFEYNELSRRHYAMAEIEAILGAGWEIRRLRRDARLDRLVERAWNCVAVHQGSPWAPVVRPLMADG